MSEENKEEKKNMEDLHWFLVNYVMNVGSDVGGADLVDEGFQAWKRIHFYTGKDYAYNN